MTGQETDVLFPRPVKVSDRGTGGFRVSYREDAPGLEGDGSGGGSGMDGDRGRHEGDMRGGPVRGGGHRGSGYGKGGGRAGDDDGKSVS
jgi:hypothetical protein